MPRSNDGTLNFGIAPASPAAVPARAVSTEQSSTAASFDAAARGSAPFLLNNPVRLRVLMLLLEGARDLFPTPRPQDDTLAFGIAPALPVAVATRDVSTGNSCTAASFDAAVRGSDMVARDIFPRLVNKTAHWFTVLRLRCLLLCPPTPFLLEIPVRLRVLMPLLEGAIWSLVMFSHASPARRHTGVRYCARVACYCAHQRRFCWKLQYGFEF